MGIFSQAVSRWAARAPSRTKAQSLSSSFGGTGGWFRLWGSETNTGTFQQAVSTDGPRQILAYSAVYASVTVIAQDIAKLCVEIIEEDDAGVSSVVRTAPHLVVLKKPNHYQNRITFFQQWIVSKLLYGNAYVLKVRDERNVVVKMYVLDATRVTPMVAEDGSVFYQLSVDELSGLPTSVTVPARDMIHDSMVALWHPLIGVSPIYACAISATQGNKIQSNSTKFFDNMSRPSGALTAPGAISDEVAGRLKLEWEKNFKGDNIGRLAVLGDGLKYEAMTIPAQEAQLIEQQRWTVEDIARCFHVPMFKIGGPVPGGTTIEGLNQMYYSDCLQALIESAELALDEGLALPKRYHTRFDLTGLIRMDRSARYDALNKAISGGWLAPNEARASEDYGSVEGGDSPVMQQQNYSLAALAKRDAREDPFAPAPAPAPAPAAPAPAPPPPEEPEDEELSVDLGTFVRLISDKTSKGIFDDQTANA